MATNCKFIENVSESGKCDLTTSVSTPSLTMTHEEKQDSNEKSATSSDCAETTLPTNSHMKPPNPVVVVADDVFENVFDASMADLEHASLDGYESDSESGNEDNDDEASFTGRALVSNGSDDLTCSSGLGCSVLASFPRSSSFEYHSSSSDSDIDQAEEIFSAINLSPKAFPTDSRNADIFLSRPYLLPFTERRRLSQCKEEDEEDGTGDKSPQPQGSDGTAAPKFEKYNLPTPPPPPPPPPTQTEAHAEKFKELERLRQKFMHKIDKINTSHIADISKASAADTPITPPPPPPPIPPTILPASLISLLQSSKSGSTAKVITKHKLTEPNTTSSIEPTNITPSKPPSAIPMNSTPISSLRTPSPERTIVKGKFTITKALETPDLQKLRTEADKLKHLDASTNAHTISFPCSFGGYSSVQGLFSQRYGSQKLTNVVPHLDKKFFDSSLVEIRSTGLSSTSLNNSEAVDRSTMSQSETNNQSMKCDTSLKTTSGGVISHLDDVWIKRPTNSPKKAASVGGDDSSVPTTAAPSEDEQDGRLPGSRPSSAPAEPNAKAARKASKKMEKEARRQEKEVSRREKEARKMERETARRLEREAAKLEKINRNTEKISRSTERMAPRSGSLERRRSGDESPVLNQSTVHGIASPNRRPTIFDVFRPRAKSDAKRQRDKLLLDPLAAIPVTGGGSATPATKGTDRDSSSTSSTHSGSGGIMNTMKVAMQHTGLISGGHHQRHPAVTVTAADNTTTSAKTKYKDGSAHPHQGSDAHYYHTVTAVRRADASRSPMTKVMDLFRHRSNSAVSEADKRKARAAAHQQQLAVQSRSTVRLTGDFVSSSSRSHCDDCSNSRGCNKFNDDNCNIGCSHESSNTAAATAIHISVVVVVCFTTITPHNTTEKTTTSVK